MYINDRDQINYHGFLKALRTMNGLTLKNVSTGVCTESGIHRIEKGDRVPEKLIRDRITSRLGISGEKYEDYLQPKEYVQWELRQRIIKAVENKDIEAVERGLEELGEIESPNRVQKQFEETVRFMLLELKNAPEEERRDCVQKAVKCTVPSIKKAFEGAHLLADQELNLILEFMRLETPKKTIRDVTAWRVSEYEKVIHYMDNAYMEDLQKAKVYPKATYYICQSLLDKELSEAEVRHALELCHNAIELLRDTSRLYYFVELTECRRDLITRLMAYDLDEAERKEWEAILEKNNQWENVFKELYAEYHVAAYMSDFGYLYYETECHNVVEVIETRRKMLKLSRSKLSAGVCTDKTIVRFEREGKNPSWTVARGLFEKMGLCAEYRRTRFISIDIDILAKTMEIAKNINDLQLDEWEKNLDTLKNCLYVDITHNKQEIIRYEALLDAHRNKISKERLYDRMKAALECTLPISSLKKTKKRYLTRNEITCINDLAFDMSKKESELYLKIICDECKDILNTEKINVARLCVYEFLIDGIVNYLGNNGEYVKSSEISNKILRECLTYRRMQVIPNNLYNIEWNYQENNKGNNSLDVVYMKKLLDKCILISDLLGRNKKVAFFQDKFNDLN